MASLPLPTSIIPTSIQSYTSKEWEQKRKIITELYRDERKPLHIVQAILAQRYTFRPTAAMLKKRIKKWDLDRNKKHPDMLVALRLALQREAIGQKTVFSIRGCLVTFEDVKQYFRRKGVRDLKSLVSDASNSSPTTRIVCRTPEPETPVERSDTRDPGSLASAGELSPHHEFAAWNVDADGSVVALPDPHQVDRTVSMTSTLGQVEQLLYLGRAYYDAIFDSPGWVIYIYTFYTGDLQSFYFHMFDGQLLLEENNVTEAFLHFGSAFDLVCTLLKQQLVMFLPFLYRLLLPDGRIQRQEVVSQLLDFVSRMATTRGARLRPIQQSLSLLSRMSIDDRGESSKRVLQFVLDRVRICFEPDFAETWRSIESVLCIRAQADLELCGL